MPESCDSPSSALHVAEPEGRSSNTRAAIHETVRVELGDRGYDILVGDGLIHRAGLLLKPLLPRPRAVIVTDARVATLHLAALEDSLRAAAIESDAIVLEPGEETKSFAVLTKLLDDLLARKVERSDMILAFGGGVIGDIAGFAASILRRGVDFIQIPTTLLAQVDSSVGGKTGINSGHGKNLIGSFHQPRLVLADTRLLATLPERERRAGYAEVVKYGLIDDANFFTWLEQNGARVLAGDSAALVHAITACCRSKARIVAEDERESGRRALLNLGHTFAHALEAEFGYGGRLLHGEAVAVGMQLAFDLSVRLGLCPTADAERLRRHLAATGLASTIGALGRSLDPDILIGHMAQDKKVQEGRVTFILAEGIGRAVLRRDVPHDALRDVLEQSVAL